MNQSISYPKGSHKLYHAERSAFIFCRKRKSAKMMTDAPPLQTHGENATPDLVIPIVGFLVASGTAVARAEAKVLDAWGPALLRTKPVPFTHTRYYEGEMGLDIRRYWIAGQTLVDPLELAAMKRCARGWEKEFTVHLGPEGNEARRSLNLDPGYVSLDQVVLASTKAAYHRIRIASDLHAEITLGYWHGAFQPLPWSYPDYVEARPFFHLLRKCLKLVRRKGCFEFPKQWVREYSPDIEFPDADD